MMENKMVGNAGYMTDIEPGSLADMIELTKEARTRLRPINGCIKRRICNA